MPPRPGTLGLVRECYSKWERRAPLTPDHVAQLVGRGLRVIVQPCDRRIFANGEYERAGAAISDDLEEANAIFGVKQVPVGQLLPRRAYMFFSHVIKAQPENMGLLDEIRARHIRLFDYECVTEGGEPGAPRTVAFGAFAGRAGMIGGLRGLGERALNLGYSTPFLSMGSAYMYPDLSAGQEAICRVGEAIRGAGLPAQLAPFTFVFTGDGAASRGAREIFSLLPHTMVAPEELAHLPPDPHQLFGCVVGAEHMAARTDGAAFDAQHYYAHPSAYHGTFADSIVPHASAIVHCSYWDPRYARLLTVEQLRRLRGGGHDKLLGVVDISCDIGGAFEMLTHSTLPEAPYYLFDVHAGKARSDLSGDGLLMCGVDILPSELPREASAHFGDALIAADMVADMANMDFDVPWAQTVRGDGAAAVSAGLVGACIAADGELVERFAYIDQMRASREKHSSKLAGGEEQGHRTPPEQLAGSTVLELHGHLFDTGILNGILDLLEQAGSSFAIVGMDVSPNRGVQLSATTTWLQLSVLGGREALDAVLLQVEALAASQPSAEVSVIEQPDYCMGEYAKTLAILPTSPTLSSTV